MIFNDRDIYQGKSFLNYGEYSEGEVELFRSLLSEGDVALEVGANIGSHTIPLAQMVGKTGLVLALEPERNNYYTLCGNVAINNLSNVRCWQKAAGDHKGVIKVPEIDVENTDNFGAIELDADYSHYSTYNVDLLTLDHVSLGKCKLVKVDVEGMEEKVLRGAEGFIQTHRPFLYVENDRVEKADSLMTFIHQLRYRMCFHCPSMYNPDNYYGLQENVMGKLVSINLLCIPDESDYDFQRFGLHPVKVG